jgi:hypothetical protein
MSLLFKLPDDPDKGVTIPDEIKKRYGIKFINKRIEVIQGDTVISVPADKYIIEEEGEFWTINVYRHTDEKNILSFSGNIAFAKAKSINLTQVHFI